MAATLFFNAGAASSDASTTYRELRYQSVIGQTADFTCGPAAIATLLTHYYGQPVTEQSVTERSVAEMNARGKQVTEGLTLLSLKKVLEEEQVTSAGYKLTLEQLRTVMAAGLPVVVNVVYPRGHYYLVLHVDERTVLIADPSWGVRSQPLPNFLNAWNGVVLVPRPDEAQATRARAEVAAQVSKYQERLERLRTGG
ncbi:cysteine peptidase family C39 domain-containing protein [Deinococcus sp.]|uniref:C39 family peptidase n=1 Tax=Deinococcus sp. TaxID=47478 RepID=UPI0025F34656|nr:cysteine peptidase family C39 domain-containing protein [Deinococcus sp.]